LPKRPSNAKYEYRTTNHEPRDTSDEVRNTRRVYPELVEGPALRSLLRSRVLSRPSTLVENSLQIDLFMQNKPNFRKSQMNVSILLKMDYENKRNWTLGQSKPNSNPIKPNLQDTQMSVNSILTKVYERNDIFAVQKNKPNSNPISRKAKMNVNLFTTKDYENKSNWTLSENKPKQTQSQNPIYPQRAKIKHAVATAEAAKLLPWLDYVVCLRVSGSLTTKKHKRVCPKRRNSWPAKNSENPGCCWNDPLNLFPSFLPHQWNGRSPQTHGLLAPANTVEIILRPYENMLLGNSRTGAALLVELILGKDLKFASRPDNRRFAFLGEEIYPALRPDRRGRISSLQTLSPENFAGFRPETLGDTGLGDQEKERPDIKH